MSKTTHLPARLLEGQRHTLTIGHLLNTEPVAPTRADERALLCYVVPPWQRDVVWSEAQQTRFIEGIFLGLGTGYYVVHEPEWDESGNPRPTAGYLIDGQQRLTAIDRFVRGELTIFGNIRYDDLSLKDKRTRFWNVSFPSVEIEYTEQESLLKQLYERLCFGGTPHTQADLQRLGPDFADTDGPTP